MKERLYKMKKILTIIALIIILFDFFMATPWGFFWDMENNEKHKPNYGIIIMFITLIPLSIILEILKNYF